MLEVLLIGPRRILVYQWWLAISIRFILCRLPADQKGHDDVEALVGTVLQVLVRFLATCLHEHIPARIAQGKERLALFDQIPLIGTDSQIGRPERVREAHEQ